MFRKQWEEVHMHTFIYCVVWQKSGGLWARWIEVYHCPLVCSSKFPFLIFTTVLCVFYSGGVTVPNCEYGLLTLLKAITNCSKCFYSRVPQNCPRTYKLPSFDPDGDNVRCRYGRIRSGECSSCTSPSGFDLDQVSQQIHKQGMRKHIGELIDF